MSVTTIVINSYKDNTIALTRLIKDIKDQRRFKQIRLIVCIGGYLDSESNIISHDGNITTIRCNTNSIDYTGFVALIECTEQLNFTPKTKFLYLHDTCATGPDFLDKLSQIDTSHHDNIRLTAKQSMNIGIYTMRSLIRLKNFILYRTRNTNQRDATKYKKLGFNWEDSIFKQTSSHTSICQHKGTITEYCDYYSTGTTRQVTYYKELDLFKIKSNWTRETDGSKLSL